MSIRRAGILSIALVLIALPLLGLMQAGSTLQATGPRIYLDQDSTDTTAFSALAPRRATRPSFLIPVGNSTKRDRTVELTFFGLGADDSTINYRVTAVEESNSVTAAGVLDDYQEQVLGDGVITLGTQLGVSTKGATTAHRLADTLTFTPTTFCTKMAGAYGGVAPVVYSPADNTEARLWIPDVGNAKYIRVYFDLDTATAANCYYKSGT